MLKTFTTVRFVEVVKLIEYNSDSSQSISHGERVERS